MNTKNLSVREHQDSPTTYTHYRQHLKILQTKQTINQIELLKLLNKNTKQIKNLKASALKLPPNNIETGFANEKD